MKITKEESNLLSRLAAGSFDGVIGRDLTTTGGSTIRRIIKNGVPSLIKQGPSKRFFNGKENEIIGGTLHILDECTTDQSKLDFLKKFGWLIKDTAVQAYSAKFKPKR